MDTTINQAFVKRVAKTSVYEVYWCNKVQARFTNKADALEFCDSFNNRVGFTNEESENSNELYN